MIKQLENRLEILEFLGWINATPVVDTTRAEVIGRYLLGHYQALVAIDDKNNPVGLMVYYVNEKTHTLFIVLLYARKQVGNFIQEFLTLCKKTGIKRIRGYSTHELNVFKNMPGVKKVYSVYEKEI